MSTSRPRPRARAAAAVVGLVLALAAGIVPAGAAAAADTPGTGADARRQAAQAKLPAAQANGTAVADSARAETADSAQLKTWWHDNHEFNTTSPVQNDKVRRSSFYDVKVATAAAPTTRYDSFAYMSIPRSGKGKIGYTKEDGAEFASSANLTMSWSSFQYSTDVWVDVSLRTGQTVSSADQVKIKPSSLNFAKELVNDRTVRIKVPYDAKGHRFSVEFDPQLYTAYNDMSGPANDAGKLTTQGGGGNRAIHTEPRNSMMIFAEPTPAGAERDRLVPTADSGSIHYPQQGRVTNLNTISEEIVYFRPGTYYMTSKYHALLPKQVKWVYLAPGAYVKGAIRFPDDSQGLYKVTGHGVFSGEQYVYEADTNNNYDHLSGASNCHASCVKMLQFQSSDRQQYLDLQGVTINEPPYHSFVVYGNEQRFQMRVDNYKQVGSWYWQTDGIELYRGSTMKNTFFHANDDVLKMYHSDVTIDDTVIWKGENGPVIQWGWTPRNIDNVRVTNTHVIHNRMYWKDVKYNTCILNSSSHWEDMGSTTTADPGAWVKNMTFENITVEGMTNCAIRVFALSSTENIHVKNLKIGAWNGLDPSSQVSLLKRYTNSAGQKVTLGNETRDSRGLKLENYTVGGTVISKSGDNWGADKLGRLGFDAETWDNWNAWGSGGNNPGPAPVTGGKIVNGATSKCVDRADGGTANGTAIQQWTCADVPSMAWSLDGQQLKSGGKCLDVVGGGTANGTKAHLWDCGGWDSQKWAFQSDGTLKNLKSGRCLDIEGQSSSDGARLHLWDCGGWDSQKWAVTS
ncbi:family 49 glycosyl hydrolase [Streptomyces sp. S1A]|uniref:family 49 glycosyl hydrolase n=1 Tax=Streptomyces sp. ICN903 TaxID=2964654 RepID=UPI001EDA2096|nr:family 49 glycosyl hydrolase [Streptomyces sp. ICN903]MCG3042544.1 family 49 glycosyl hydrolase [Streptomyces sp. ICN903]